MLLYEFEVILWFLCRIYLCHSFSISWKFKLPAIFKRTVAFYWNTSKMNFENRCYVYLCHWPLRMCIQCFLSVSRFCNHDLHHQHWAAFVQPLMILIWQTGDSFTIRAVCRPHSWECANTKWLIRKKFEWAIVNWMFNAGLAHRNVFTFRNVGRDVSHTHLHVFKVVNPSLCVSLPHFSQCLVLVCSRPQ